MPSDEDGVLIASSSVPRIDSAVRWVEQYGDNLIGAKQKVPTNKPALPNLIRGWLMQDLAQGEVALLNYAIRKQNVHSFQIALFGLWDLSNFSFRLQLRFGNTTIGTTSLIGQGGVATADDVKQALHLATAIPLDRMLVGLGNPAYSTLGNSNSLSEVAADSAGIFSYPTAVWNITFLDYENQVGLELLVLDNNGGLISGSSIIVSLRTKDVATNYHVPVFDPYDLPLKAPLKRGSKVIAQWFSDAGYGVVGAMGKDFHDTSGDAG
jgi:hypothetical protein